MTNLPIVSNCDGCGACCREQESPPMYLLYLLGIDDGRYTPNGDEWDEDATRVLLLPVELKEELRAYADHMRKTGRHPNGGVCIWFDEATLRCKHYELRPDICREGVHVGDEACIDWRRAYGIGSIDEVPTEMVSLLGELGDVS